jgi:hypothetical protein
VWAAFGRRWPAARSTKNIKNNPMQSSQMVAGMDGFGNPAEAFDMSGKSPPSLHHRAFVWLNQVRLVQLICLYFILGQVEVWRIEHGYPPTAIFR